MLMNQLLRSERIGILALQETHITCAQAEELNLLFDGILKVYVSPDPLRPTAARGVAYAVNLRVCECEQICVTERRPGRALELRLTRRRGTALTLLNVYAPNDVGKNKAFWEELQLLYGAARVRNPDVVLGDFNIVESAMDRAPARADDVRASDALAGLLSSLRLVDGWRARNGVARNFTFLQAATSSQSRIDRMYVSAGVLSKSHSWHISPAGVPTDHCLVSAALADYNKPETGPGRWRVPALLLADKMFLEEVQAIGLVEAERTYSGPQGEYLAQWRLQGLKDKLLSAARKRVKQLVPKIDKRLNAI
ncbi:Endonuclease/exonuclease/phosphatase, partial [Cerioporus squamosus]